MKASADLRKRRPDVFCTQFHPAIRLDDNGHCLGCAYEGRYTPPDVEVTGWPVAAVSTPTSRSLARSRCPTSPRRSGPVPEKADNPVGDALAGLLTAAAHTTDLPTLREAVAVHTGRLDRL
jgi:hypothetical protein